MLNAEAPNVPMVPRVDPSLFWLFPNRDGCPVPTAVQTDRQSDLQSELLNELVLFALLQILWYLLQNWFPVLFPVLRWPACSQTDSLQQGSHQNLQGTSNKHQG